MIKRVMLKVIGAILFVVVLSMVFDKLRVYLYVRGRTAAILEQAGQADVRTVLLGDSIVEGSRVATLCGGRALNAGISGANISGVRDIARKLEPKIKPRLIIIAAGINDSSKEYPTSVSSFKATYKEVIDLGRRTGATVVAINIEPVARGNTVFDPKHIARNNKIIAGLGVPVIDLWSIMREPDTVSLPASSTDDGTHPNARGYALWTAAADKACKFETR